MILLSTIWHTGTHSLQTQLRKEGFEVKQLHCCEDALRLSREMETYTTYRDPYEVAAAWIVRSKLPKWLSEWERQWTHYHQIKHNATVINLDDLRFHENHFEGGKRADKKKIDQIMGDYMRFAYE